MFPHGGQHTADIQEVKERQVNEMKIWTGWADISATGEGRAICSMIATAQTEADFRVRVREALGEYFERSFDVGQGLVRNGVTEALWAPAVLDHIEANQSTGNISASASLHFNFS